MSRKKLVWVTVLLLASSALIYLVQVLIFHDARNTVFYMLQDWAFLPVQIVLVTIVAGGIINRRERENRMEKTRMLAGSFFGDMGFRLLIKARDTAADSSGLSSVLSVDDAWKARDFEAAAAKLKNLPIKADCRPEDLEEIKELLTGRKMSLLIIASNPVLLEHESFTDMLWAIFHLTDELELRDDLRSLPPADTAHLNVDMERVVSSLLANWLCHMGYLREQYPYLYLMEAARNPFRAA